MSAKILSEAINEFSGKNNIDKFVLSEHIFLSDQLINFELVLLNMEDGNLLSDFRQILYIKFLGIRPLEYRSQVRDVLNINPTKYKIKWRNINEIELEDPFFDNVCIYNSRVSVDIDENEIYHSEKRRKYQR